eukprot:COSAG02_NODE_5482_length_4289_cov_28.142434_1_plen_55_part_00
MSENWRRIDLLQTQLGDGLAQLNQRFLRGYVLLYEIMARFYPAHRFDELVVQSS